MRRFSSLPNRRQTPVCRAWTGITSQEYGRRSGAASACEIGRESHSFQAPKAMKFEPIDGRSECLKTVANSPRKRHAQVIHGPLSSVHSQPETDCITTPILLRHEPAARKAGKQQHPSCHACLRGHSNTHWNRLEPTPTSLELFQAASGCCLANNRGLTKTD